MCSAIAPGSDVGRRAASLADKEQVLEKKRGEPGAGQAISKTPGFRDLQFQGSLETLYAECLCDTANVIGSS